jgi:hypothetical protein
LLEALRYILDRPQLADLVIPDLARWQDWSVMDKLVELFKNADDESSWVRVPVINYLRACPLPKAKEYLDELAKIDPDSIKKANNFFPLGAGATARDKGSSKADEKQDSSDEKKEEDEDDKSDESDSAQAAAAAPKLSQVNKPILEEPVAQDPETEPLAEAPSIFAVPRLSRSAAPFTNPDSNINPLHIYGWMALAAAGIAILLTSILRGGHGPA